MSSGLNQKDTTAEHQMLQAVARIISKAQSASSRSIVVEELALAVLSWTWLYLGTLRRLGHV